MNTLRSGSESCRLSTFRRQPALVLLLLLAAAVPLAGCGEEAEPVAEVAVEPQQLTLPYPEAREVEMSWQPETPIQPDGPALVFVHLLDADGEVERTFDHPFPREWRPGQAVTYPVHLYQSLLAPPLPEGEMALTVGLYDADGRWPLEGGEEMGREEYRMATVEIPPFDPSVLPRLDFVGEWSPLEPGADRQVLGSRWLGREGSITVEGAPTAGRLGLLLETPEAPAGVERVMEGPAEAPSLKVTSTCDGSERRLSGTGLSRMDLDVAAGEPCEIRLQPNFHFEDPDYRNRAVRLVIVTWNPQEG